MAMFIRIGDTDHSLGHSLQTYMLLLQKRLRGDYALFVAIRGMSNLRAFLGS